MEGILQVPFKTKGLSDSLYIYTPLAELVEDVDAAEGV